MDILQVKEPGTSEAQAIDATLPVKRKRGRPKKSGSVVVAETKDVEIIQPGTIVKRGRPIKIKTAVALKNRIKQYFDECDEKEVPYTMSGLALKLDITRDTLMKYESEEYYGYGDIIGEAKTRIENYAEKRLFERNCVGAIFALKNNFPGWLEKQETTVKGPLGSVLDYIQQHASNIITRPKKKEQTGEAILRTDQGKIDG